MFLCGHRDAKATIWNIAALSCVENKCELHTCKWFTRPPRIHQPDGGGGQSGTGTRLGYGDIAIWSDLAVPVGRCGSVAALTLELALWSTNGGQSGVMQSSPNNRWKERTSKTREGGKKGTRWNGSTKESSGPTAQRHKVMVSGVKSERNCCVGTRDGSVKTTGKVSLLW